MTNNLVPYPAMKESGVEWLGDVPKHWEVGPLKYCVTRFYSGGTPHSGVESFYCSPSEGIPWLLIADMTGQQRIRHTQKAITEAGKASKGLELLPAGTILYSMYASIGTVSILEIDATINQAIIGIQPQKGKFNAEYCLYYLEFLRLHVVRLSTTSTQANLNAEKVRNIPTLLPPLVEQAAIVRYLDYVDRRVRQVVRAKEKLIGLLDEQKQAIIHHAVTRGLDPDVSLKFSGVEWLGDVPKHWEVVPLKHWVRMNDAVLSEDTDAKFEFDYLDIGSVGTGILTQDPQRILFENAPSRARRVVRNDDTIVSTVRTYLKAVWYANNTEDNLIASTGFAVLTPRQGTSPKFVSYLAQSNSFTDRVTAESVGIAYPAISESRLGTFHVSLPPIAEQAAIVEYLDKATTDIDTTIARARREIELLREYRTRLIADVVTGKIDVRKVAAQLPNETEDQNK